MVLREVTSLVLVYASLVLEMGEAGFCGEPYVTAPNNTKLKLFDQTLGLQICLVRYHCSVVRRSVLFP